MYICLYINMYVYICIYIYVYVYIPVCLSVCVRMCTYVCICKFFFTTTHYHTLQHTATHLQQTATHCNTLKRTVRLTKTDRAVYCSMARLALGLNASDFDVQVLQRVAVFCGVLQHVAVFAVWCSARWRGLLLDRTPRIARCRCCSVWPCVAVCSRVLQCSMATPALGLNASLVSMRR